MGDTNEPSLHPESLPSSKAHLGFYISCLGVMHGHYFGLALDFPDYDHFPGEFIQALDQFPEAAHLVITVTIIVTLYMFYSSIDFPLVFIPELLRNQIFIGSDHVTTE